MTGRGVGGTLQRHVIKTARLPFHLLDGIADGSGSEALDEPDGGPGDEAFDVLTANERDALAETGAVEFDETGAVVGLFGLHFREHSGSGGVILAETFGEFAIDAAVLLFKRDGEGEDFAFGQVFEVFGHNLISLNGVPIEHSPAPGNDNRLDEMRETGAMVQQVITRDPEIMGGTPCFVGTRVPFQTLLDYIEGGETLDEFLEQFPGVTREMAIAALESAKEFLLARIA